MSAVLERVRQRGLHIRTDGVKLFVGPSERLDEGLRREIVADRARIITALQLDAELVAAINQACDLRGDDEANRAGLIRECRLLLPEGKRDMRDHFLTVAALWKAAGGQR